MTYARVVIFLGCPGRRHDGGTTMPARDRAGSSVCLVGGSAGWLESFGMPPWFVLCYAQLPALVASYLVEASPQCLEIDPRKEEETTDGRYER